ncbi:hypothetical protein DPEC_G00154760 [Dallia pectoralis]|uniref:Uncharacterized protein n=1 Tax=Dallia pectoralis TaxID=75939 RepID=A0ACC2GJW6_DALPE|nr:hypothetical protein DPEC_G00154760 [Dallia pectoralis]
MLVKTFFTLWAISTVVSTAVFLERNDAHVVLDRFRRANSGYFEELKPGNLERECLEEICNYEEAREVFEDDGQTEVFWLGYHRRDPCLVHSCKNNGTCVPTNSSYPCLCPEGFHGKFCQTVFEDTLKCLYLNGGCEHFCNHSEPVRKCFCASGYALGDDGRKCVAQVQYPCGKIPSQNVGVNQTHSVNVRLVGGNACPKGQCPWQVLLRHQDSPLCGGVIVHPKWVITAAHCVLNRDVRGMMVVAGEHNIDITEGTEQLRSVAKVIPYHLYEPTTGDGDIALLRLRMPITLGQNAVPVCLPQQDFANAEMAAIRNHAISGWGRLTSGGNNPKTGPGSAFYPPVLRRVAVPLIPNAECSLKSGFNFTTNMLCAGYFLGNVEACRGDDGSPLVTHYSNTHFLMGVVAWGKGCPKHGFYGVYTKMANFLDWAEEVMNAPVPDDNAKEMPFLLESALHDSQIEQAPAKIGPLPLL